MGFFLWAWQRQRKCVLYGNVCSVSCVTVINVSTWDIPDTIFTFATVLLYFPQETCHDKTGTETVWRKPLQNFLPQNPQCCFAGYILCLDWMSFKEYHFSPSHAYTQDECFLHCFLRNCHDSLPFISWFWRRLLW